jgi:hypothetical protein
VRRLGSPAIVGALLASGLATGVAAVAGGQAASVLLAAAQTLTVAALLSRALHGRRGWRSGEFVVAVAWALLFTVPCWIYAVDPGLLDRGSARRATLLVNVALYAYLLGLVLWRRQGPAVEGPMRVAPMTPRLGVLKAWWLFGFAALAVLLLRHGDPLEYLGRLDESQVTNRGAFFLVALALLMRFSVLAWAAARWSRHEPLEPPALGLVVAGTALIGLTGARVFVAVALVDFLLLYVLLRRALPLRRVAPWALVAGLVIVFGIGTVKRYQGFEAAHPDARVGFVEYATKLAPPELAAAYANNYVDGVRLLAIADSLVPHKASYEGLRPLLELAVRPLPNAVRPELHRQRALRAAFEPSETSAYAMPLVVTAFLAGGLLVALLAAGAVGVLVGYLDRRLASDWLAAGTVAVLVVAVVSVPGVLRAGIPAGAMLMLIEVAGMWLVARTGLRSCAGAPGVHREPLARAEVPIA